MANFLLVVTLIAYDAIISTTTTLPRGTCLPGRSSVFPFQMDSHLPRSLRYVERTASVAKLVERAEMALGSLFRWVQPSELCQTVVPMALARSGTGFRVSTKARRQGARCGSLVIRAFQTRQSVGLPLISVAECAFWRACVALAKHRNIVFAPKAAGRPEHRQPHMRRLKSK